MRTVWNIFKQNLADLARNPKALASVVAVMLLASAFAWYAVGSYWNPYAQADRLKIAVVSQDEGVSVAEAKAKATAAGVDANAFVESLGSGVSRQNENAPDGHAPGAGNSSSSSSGAAESNASGNDNAPEAEGDGSNSQEATGENASDNGEAPTEGEQADEAPAEEQQAGEASAEGQQASNGSAENPQAGEAPAENTQAEAPQPSEAAQKSRAIADSDQLVIGSVLMEALSQDTTFDWQLVTVDQARSGLASGEYYAEFVIPQNFTAEFLGVFTGAMKRPTIEYWVSEKYGPLLMPADSAMELSDADAETSADESAEAPAEEADSAEADADASLQTGESMSSGTVDAIVGRGLSQVAAQTFSDTLKNVAGTIAAKGGKSASQLDTGLDGAAQDLGTVESALSRTKDSIGQWRTAVEEAKKTLDSLKEAAPGLRDTLAAGRDELADARTAAHEVASTYGSAFAQGDESLSSMLSDAASLMENATEPLTEAQKAIDSEIAAAEKALNQCEKLINALVKADPDSSTLTDLKEQNTKLQDNITSLKKDSKAISEAAESARSTSSSLSKDAQDAIANLKDRTDTFNEVILPQLDISLDALALVMGSLDGTLGSLDAEIAQTKTLLEELEKTLQKTEDAAQTAFDALGTTKSDLNAARSDVSALANAKAVQEASSIAIFSEQNPNSFMASSVNVAVQQVYSPGSYGAGLVPLYAGLAIWIACFMLVLTFKTTTDASRFLRIRPWQSYLGRLLPIGLLALLQAAITIVGFMVMGVQVASVLALIVAGLMVAFCAASIVFALDTVFAHVGKALALLLIVAQIPLAFGVYPAQLAPEAIQAIEAWLPITHGTSAMGDAIGGSYGFAYVQNLLWLIACGMVTFALALFAQPHVIGLNRLFARKFDQADLFANDEQESLANTPGVFFGTSAAALHSQLEEELFADEQFFEDEQQQALLLMRARKYAQRYAIVRNAAPLAVIALVAALVVVSLLLPLSANDKLAALAVFAAATALVFIVSLVFENAYDKMTAQLAAAGVDTSELKNARVVAPKISAPVIAVPEAGETLIQPTLEEWNVEDLWTSNFETEWDEDAPFEEDADATDAEDAEDAEDVAETENAADSEIEQNAADEEPEGLEPAESAFAEDDFEPLGFEAFEDTDSCDAPESADETAETETDENESDEKARFAKHGKLNYRAADESDAESEKEPSCDSSSTNEEGADA